MLDTHTHKYLRMHLLLASAGWKKGMTGLAWLTFHHLARRIRMRKHEFRYIVCCHISLRLSAAMLNSPVYSARHLDLVSYFLYLFIFFSFGLRQLSIPMVSGMSRSYPFSPARYIFFSFIIQSYGFIYKHRIINNFLLFLFHIKLYHRVYNSRAIYLWL